MTTLTTTRRRRTPTRAPAGVGPPSAPRAALQPARDLGRDGPLFFLFADVPLSHLPSGHLRPADPAGVPRHGGRARHGRRRVRPVVPLDLRPFRRQRLVARHPAGLVFPVAALAAVDLRSSSVRRNATAGRPRRDQLGDRHPRARQPRCRARRLDILRDVSQRTGLRAVQHRPGQGARTAMIFWYGVVLVLAFGYLHGRRHPRPAHPVRRRQPRGRPAGWDPGDPGPAPAPGSRQSLLCGVAGVVTPPDWVASTPRPPASTPCPPSPPSSSAPSPSCPGASTRWGCSSPSTSSPPAIFGLQLLGYQGWVTDVFYGGVVVAAVAASAWVQRRIHA